ncbi:hypothetical protein HPB47_006408 [Ixodes persulcatus]|uniref:Uncharacterized protein n=1 Tax=Ixodes persulcatus TaxID=34615 RepID=A0AC60PAC6_IXOPE|nr:hypothetical protein HPB47_006408 [Ixodes persulcatus]
MKLVPLEKEVNLRFLWMLIRVSAIVRRSTNACVALYDVELDDRDGVCASRGPYPRLRAVAAALRASRIFTGNRETTPPSKRPADTS